MSLLTDFTRVDRTSPCPVCGKHDWCLVARADPADPPEVVCARIESEKRCGEAGWLHRRRSGDRLRSRSQSTTLVAFPDLGGIASEYAGALEAARLASLSRALGVGTVSLQRLHIGWNGWAFAFPMSSATGQVVGIRLRRPDGRKLAVKGSRQGLFVPMGLGLGEPLLVCEGATDTAAMLDLGFDAIGRPSCSGGLRVLAAYVAAQQVRSAVLVADRDGPGVAGAARAGMALAAHCSVRQITPALGFKDAREWVAGGARREDVDTAITAATPARLRGAIRRRA